MTPERAASRFSPRRWPVRWRLATVSAALTFAILVCFAFVVGQLAVDKLEANFRQEAQSTANDMANRLEVRSSVTGELSIEDRDISTRMWLPRDSFARIAYADGSPLREFAGVPDLGPPSEDEVVERGSLTIASQRIPSISLGQPVFVQYARDNASLDSTTDRLWLFLAGGVLGGTLLAFLAGLAVANRAMRPIASLTSAAREIAATRDPSRRLPSPESDDEVAELARTLDEMLRQLDSAREETEQIIQAQRDFVADASHELRTPLTSILANLELLEASLETEGDDEQREIVAGALGSSRRMRRLVSDLLLLARADAGRAGPTRACELSSIAAGAVAEIRPLADDREIELSAPEEVPIQGNPDDLHRLVANLVENAVRHAPSGSSARVEVRRDGRFAELVVTDDGPGIPAGMEEQIFSRFVRGGGPADLAMTAGTGLGLAIVKAVAHSHGGSVAAANAPDGGARFTVRLPVDERSPEAAPAPLARSTAHERRDS